MNIKCGEKIAVHQGYGYVSIGKFDRIDNMGGLGNCVVVKVKPKDNKGALMGEDIFISFDEFKHGRSIFQMKENGFNQWLKHLKEKVKRDNIYHKWNTKKVSLNLGIWWQFE